MIEAVSNYQPLSNLQGYSKSEINTLHLNPLSPDSTIQINPNLRPEVFIRPAPLFHDVFQVKKPRY